MGYTDNGVLRTESKLKLPDALQPLCCQMPVMDGYEATAAIRALPDTRLASLPVLALTASSLSDDIERCHAAGMDEHIAKPLDLALLKARIESWAARRRPTEAASRT